MSLEPTMDGEYPTEETEEVIRKWGCVGKDSKLALMEYVKKAWWMPEWGWSEENGVNDLGNLAHRYKISTGGWSGNERLIGAMKDNFLFWSLAWIQSRRGGHYIFEVTV